MNYLVMKAQEVHKWHEKVLYGINKELMYNAVSFQSYIPLSTTTGKKKISHWSLLLGS